MVCIPIAVTLLLLICTAGTARAQDGAAVPRLRCDTVAVGGTIRGMVLDDSTGTPLTTRGVYLKSTNCFTATDSSGSFEFRKVPPGRFSVAVANLGYRAFEPVPVEVRLDSMVRLELRLRPENMVADCREIARCARLLEARSDLAAGLTGNERLEEAVWRTTIALAGKRWDSDWTPCANVKNERVRRVLKARIPNLAPGSECVVPEPVTGSSRLVHLPGGAPARSVQVRKVEATADRAVVRSSYYVGPLWAEGWTCRFSRRDGEWVAQWCGMDWIS
jgi:hypothetical protein